MERGELPRTEAPTAHDHREAGSVPVACAIQTTFAGYGYARTDVKGAATSHEDRIFQVSPRG